MSELEICNLISEHLKNFENGLVFSDSIDFNANLLDEGVLDSIRFIDFVVSLQGILKKRC